MFSLQQGKIDFKFFKFFTFLTLGKKGPYVEDLEP
jgi:hypothetical protein